MVDYLVIDSHAHIIVPEILRDAKPAEEWRPRVAWEDGRQIVEYNGKRISSAMREFVNIETILAEMDRVRVDAVLLCPWASLMRYEADPGEVLGSCQVQNDVIASIAAKYPARVAGLGIVPLQNAALAIQELERLMGFGLCGVEIGTQVNGIYPGDPRFWPFWEACEALGAVVFMHPVEGGGRPDFRDYYLWNVIGNPMDTSIAAGHLILSGVMEAYPRLKILLAHGGGALPYIHGRLDRGYRQRPEINRIISRSPTEYLRRFYFDSITHDADALRYLVEVVGVEHVLLGSDYPFDMGNEDPADRVHAAGFDPETEGAILGRNAAGLLHLDARSDKPLP